MLVLVVMFGSDTKSKSNKSKNKQAILHQIENLYKREPSTNEEATYGIGENTCKSYI